jgi:DNA-binding response OmpR family regulator
MLKTPYQVLLVEDDPVIAKSLRLSLFYKGIAITPCPTYATGLRAFQHERFDAILLDVTLPDGSGLDLCRMIREEDALIPILMLTARVDEDSAVTGLESGANDYIRKPFGVSELVARILRLLDAKSRPTSELSFRSLQIDTERRTAHAGEKPLSLGKREFEILSLLIRKSGGIVTRGHILEALNEKGEEYDRTIDSHLSHLRKKLRDAGAADVRILPVYGVGYRLTEQ